MKRESPTTALLYNHGFRVLGGCGQEAEGTDWVDFSPGEDDRVFKLESMPVAACRVEEQRAMPIRPGKPLRERFRHDEVFCFGRDYDAAHLANHPQQEVASIPVRTVLVFLGADQPIVEIPRPVPESDKGWTQAWPGLPEPLNCLLAVIGPPVLGI
jgi:hypothetical protein